MRCWLICVCFLRSTLLWWSTWKCHRFTSCVHSVLMTNSMPCRMACGWSSLPITMAFLWFGFIIIIQFEQMKVKLFLRQLIRRWHLAAWLLLGSDLVFLFCHLGWLRYHTLKSDQFPAPQTHWTKREYSMTDALSLLGSATRSCLLPVNQRCGQLFWFLNCHQEAFYFWASSNCRNKE